MKSIEYILKYNSIPYTFNLGNTSIRVAGYVPLYSIEWVKWGNIAKSLLDMLINDLNLKF